MKKKTISSVMCLTVAAAMALNMSACGQSAESAGGSETVTEEAPSEKQSDKDEKNKEEAKEAKEPVAEKADDAQSAEDFDLYSALAGEDFELSSVNTYDSNYRTWIKFNEDGSKSIQYMNATYDTRRSDYINAWGDKETGFFESDFGGYYDVQLFLSGIETSALPSSGADVYGVFVMSTKDRKQCVQVEMKLEDAGFNDNIMLYTPDFSGLNPEPYYVVSAGLFEAEDDANSRLREVQAAGFKDAYVKLAGKYIGNRYNYTMFDAGNIEILKDCVILHDVEVTIPYWIESSGSSTMDLYVYESAKFADDADIETFSNYEKGDTPYKWIVKNYNILKSDTEAYMAYGPALSGVFNVAIDGDEITEYYGSFWWD